MDPILDDFHADLARLRRLVDLLDSITAFASTDRTGVVFQEGFLDQAGRIHKATQDCHPDVVILTGTILLYLAGRFEYFVRAEFEFLCDSVAKRSEKYKNLPREMRESIIAFTARVIADPRKYGHGEQGVKSFIANLATVLDDNGKLEYANSACLSITETNMRADSIDELFQRIGAKNVWDRIGQQAKVMVFLEVPDGAEAKNKARSYLNSFMDMRNKIAHPSTGIDWPDSAQVKKYIEFFDVLATAIAEVADIYELQLVNPKNNEQKQ